MCGRKGLPFWAAATVATATSVMASAPLQQQQQRQQPPCQLTLVLYLFPCPPPPPPPYRHTGYRAVAEAQGSVRGGQRAPVHSLHLPPAPDKLLGVMLPCLAPMAQQGQCRAAAAMTKSLSRGFPLTGGAWGRWPSFLTLVLQPKIMSVTIRMFSLSQ